MNRRFGLLRSEIPSRHIKLGYKIGCFRLDLAILTVDYVLEEGPPVPPSKFPERVVEPFDDGWPEYEEAFTFGAVMKITCYGLLLSKIVLNVRLL